MTTYYLEVRFRVAPTDVVDEFTDDLMEALLVEPNIEDPDLGVNLETADIDVMMLVAGSDQAEALTVGLAALRSSLHKIGGHTPGWEESLERALATVRPPEAAGI